MKLMKETPRLFTNSNECCGCTACCSVCPNNAITMKADFEGFEYPVIDESRCIRCYSCLRVCPFKE